MLRNGGGGRRSHGDRCLDQLEPVIDSLGMCQLQDDQILVDVAYWRTFFSRTGSGATPLLGVDELTDWVFGGGGNVLGIGEEDLDFFCIPRGFSRMGCNGELSTGYAPRTGRLAERVPPEKEDQLGAGFLVRASDRLVTMGECKFGLDDDLLEELSGGGDVFKTILSIAGPLTTIGRECSNDDRRIGRIVHFGPAEPDLFFDAWVLARWFSGPDRYGVAFCYRGSHRVGMMCYTPWIEANVPDFDPGECGSSDC